jgi:type VI protein secretion system component Hcp
MGSRHLLIQRLLPFITALFLLCSGMHAIAADVSLAWDPIVSDNISGYKVYAGNSSRVYGTPVAIGNQTTYTLTGLPDGSWYFAVTAYDINGIESGFSNEVMQTIGIVTDTTPPVISGLTSASITAAGATIVWTTNEASTSQVEYGLSTSYGNIALISSLDLSHSQTLSGLLAGTLYHYRVKSIDAAGNASVSSDGTFTTTVPVDTTPPVISGVAGSNVTSTTATIVWTTNEAANTRVDYGTTTSYNSFAFNGTMATSHSQALSGLTGGTLYYYRVRSADAAGNAAVSGDYTFTTPALPDTTAPVISSVSSANLTSTGATISWTTNEVSSTQVQYGTTKNYGKSSALNSSMVTSHTQALSGLSASTLYHYRVRSADAAGNAALSGDYIFTTPAPADTTAPVISSVSSTKLTTTGATISWTTNEVSSTQVEYGTSTGYGASSALNSSRVTAHSQALSGLSAGTLYHYRVRSADAAGNTAVSGDYTFTTSTPLDTTAPVISSVTSSNLTSTGATISWATDEAANSQIEYGITSSYGTSAALDNSMVTGHSQSLSSLSADTLYHYRVKSADAAGNPAVSGDYTFTTAASDVVNSALFAQWFRSDAVQAVAQSNPVSSLVVKSVSTMRVRQSKDVTPPKIYKITTQNISNTGATISWTTDEAADSQVDYGLTTSYGFSSIVNPSLVKIHSQALTALSAGTPYHYRVRSRDASGNPATSSDMVFTTTGTASVPVISAAFVSEVTGQSARISWSTDKLSNSEVEYWTTGKTARKAVLGFMVMQHSITLNNLDQATQYQFIIKSTDSESNQAKSTEYSFATLQSSGSAVALPHFFNLADQNALGEEVLEEIALTNLGSQAATLSLTAVDSEGNLIAGQNIVNPSSLQVSPKAQSATLDMDIFGEGLGLSGSNGWIKVENATSDVGGFSLVFGSNLNFVDGIGFGETPLTDFAFTEIETNGSTRINVANTNTYDATVVFDLMKADGTVQSTQSRVISANGALVTDLFGDLFAAYVPEAANYVRANSTKGVLSFELMKKEAGDIASLAGQDITAGGTVLYAPHYVVGSAWKTSLSVINLDSRAGSVQLQFVGENGVQIGTANTLSIPANGKLYVTDPAFFHQPILSSTYTGYVKITSNGVRLAGSAVYGDSSGTTFSSALPLMYSLQTSAVYWHAVSNDMYRSGIAMVNPNATVATAVVELFAADGTSLERVSESIPAGRRTAKLLTEYFPSMVGQNQTSGYIKITSDKPLASYALFGTGNLSVLSAIPGKTIQ